MKKWLVVGIFFAVLGCLTIFAPSQTGAISVSEFMPGRIIDDEVFYNKNSMSINEIQSFLDRHVPACDTWGTGPSGYGNLTRAQYNQQIRKWPGPPYVCLNNYQENPNTGETSFEKGGGAFNGGISAAHIIYDAAQKYNINPQVLLVMLRKESLNLFSDNWPMKSQYKYAMGYACPDSGPGYSANCDNEQSGFYKQVMKAAWQLNRYKTNIGEYNYQPGRTNYIQYNPNPTCGGSNVYIENVATASLYIYTPYQPNQAALNAYPGTSNCGAYGNRNFWFFFREWFGSTTQSDIIGDASTGRLYLKSENKKYYIPNLDVLSRLSSLSKRISYVSKQYLDSLSTGPTMNRTVRDPRTGAIYLIDSGYKLQFNSCEMLADYGLSCANNPNLEDYQLTAYQTGPNVTNYFQTSGDERKYYIRSGVRAEIYDQVALSKQGLGGYTNRLSRLSIKDLPVGKPIVRNDTIIRDDTSGALYYNGVDGLSYLNGDMYNSKVFNGLTVKNMLKESVAKLSKTANMRGYVKDENGNRYLLGQSVKYSLQDSSISPVAVSSGLLSILPTETTPSVIKSSSLPMVYLYRDSTLYPIHYWSDVLKFSPQGRVAVVHQSSVASMPKAVLYAPATTLVKSNNDAAVYMIDKELNTKKRLYSQDISGSMGVSMSNLRTISREYLDQYRNNGNVSDLMNCGGDLYIAGGGSIHYVSGDVFARYGIDINNYEKYDMQVCNNLSKGNPMSRFVLVKNTGSIYMIQNGKKHYIGSQKLYADLGGTSANTVTVTNNIASMVSSGKNL